jgi:hypothetical protein
MVASLNSRLESNKEEKEVGHDQLANLVVLFPVELGPQLGGLIKFNQEA